MTGQEARITGFCDQLKLIRLAGEWPGIAQDAAKTEACFADFLERALQCEMMGRDERRRAALTRLATMPSIKTLKQFDWSHAGRRQLAREGTQLESIERRKEIRHGGLLLHEPIYRKL